MTSRMDANPQVRHALSDPAVLRQSLEMMRNPNAFREAMRHQDIALSQLENHPEGFNAMSESLLAFSACLISQDVCSRTSRSR